MTTPTSTSNLNANVKGEEERNLDNHVQNLPTALSADPPRLTNMPSFATFVFASVSVCDWCLTVNLVDFSLLSPVLIYVSVPTASQNASLKHDHVAGRIAYAKGIFFAALLSS